MLDINVFRENLDDIKASQVKRFRKLDYPDLVVEWDQKWRDVLKQVQQLQAEKNKTSKEVGKRKKAGEDASDLMERSREIANLIPELEATAEEYLKKRDEYRYGVGNLIHESVPVAETEEGNETMHVWGDIPEFAFQPRSHVELVETTDGANLKVASEIAGSRFYYLKNDLVFLNLALIQFAVDFLVKKGFTPWWTPFFVKREVIAEAAELADFEDTLYKIEGEDLFMIATSEQTLAALHRQDFLDENTLPRKYCGVSSCFRREAGSHGKDTLGIFRVHQFEKVEQYVFCKADESWQMHEELIANAEEIYQTLGIPYRVVNIASGELNDNAAKKYDLEGWFPGSNTYRELVSCSNCLDYQTRKLGVKTGVPGDKESWYTPHSLNSTAIATERAMCCILENYQNEDGTVRVPDALQPYMGGRTVIGPKP
ncbi:MAG TPA: serine--tRNA ligase [Candidatus Lokiarchaeia archaeon]|nr:serine--tRNA ligase [Candidatus Lokiarchaeia archaeon]